LFILAGSSTYALEKVDVKIKPRFVPIELPKTAKKRVFEVNRESLSLIEEFLPLFGVEILLRSYLIEFDFTFRELGQNWGNSVQNDVGCGILVGRVGVDTEIAIESLRLFESFIFQFLEGAGKSALMDYRSRVNISNDVWILFELANERIERPRHCLTEKVEERRGFFFGFPEDESEWELPKYQLCPANANNHKGGLSQRF
jgi:hypothetical protein